MKVIISSFVFILSSFMLHAQEETKRFSTFDLGIEFQVYPTGIMPGLRFETNLNARSTATLRLGLNIFDHKDFPKQAGINMHDSETGSGPGFSLGYKRYFRKSLTGLYLGLRNDIWFNKVDWSTTYECINCEPITTIGETKIIVVQPTIETGWLFLLGKKQRFLITPELAFGYEWNVKVEGDPTGYGFILLAGARLGMRLH